MRSSIHRRVLSSKLARGLPVIVSKCGCAIMDVAYLKQRQTRFSNLSCAARKSRRKEFVAPAWVCRSSRRLCLPTAAMCGSSMPNPAHVLRWPGLFLLFSLTISGCAWIPLQLHAIPPLEYLSTALDATPDQREKMWRHARKGDGSRESELRIAVMQSLPGHTGYDAPAARRHLQALRGGAAPDEVAAVAQLRLAEMHAEDALRDENQSLRQRLSQLVDIERSMVARDRP